MYNVQTLGTGLYGDVEEITIDVLSWSVSEKRRVLVKVGAEEVVWGGVGSGATGAEGLDSSPPTLSYFFSSIYSLLVLNN